MSTAEASSSASPKKGKRPDKKKEKKADGLHAAGDDEAGWKLQVMEEEKADKASHVRSRPSRQGKRIKSEEEVSAEKERDGEAALDEATMAKKQERKEKRQEVKARQEADREAAGGSKPGTTPRSKGAKGTSKSSSASKSSTAKCKAAAAAAAATAAKSVDDGFFDMLVGGDCLDGDVLHAGRLRLVLQADGTPRDAYCVLLSSLQLLCLDINRGSFDPAAGSASYAKSLSLQGGAVTLALEEEPPAVELRLGGDVWMAVPLGYYDQQQMQLAALAWEQLLAALLRGQWPPTEGDDDEAEAGPDDDDEDLEVPDWHAGHYYALDGSAASYDAECLRDPYKKLALEA